MTAAEQASLDGLRGVVEEGFREIRGLMETRRLEEVRVQEQLDRRLARVESTTYTNKVLIRAGGWLVATLIAVASVLIAVVH